MEANILALQSGQQTNTGNISALSGRVSNVESGKLDASVFNGHNADNVRHVSQTDRDLWDSGGYGIAGLQSALQAEINARILADNLLLPKENINMEFVQDIEFDEYNGNQTATAILQLINPATQDSIEIVKEIPIASPTMTGLQAKETATAIMNLLARVASLEGQESRFPVSFSTNVPSEITQDELNTLYYAAAGVAPGTPIPDHTRLIDPSMNIVFDYFLVNDTWTLAIIGPIAIATNNTYGVSMGADVPGKAYAEDDGTWSLVGFDAMQTALSNLTNRLNQLDRFNQTAGPVNTRPSTAWPLNSVTYLRSGDTVTVVVNTGNANAPTGVFANVIPVGFRPIVNLRSIGGVTFNDKLAWCELGANGSLQASIGNTTPCAVTFTYVTRDAFPVS
jgi:hypothetical protein